MTIIIVEKSRVFSKSGHPNQFANEYQTFENSWYGVSIRGHFKWDCCMFNPRVQY